MNRRIFTSRRLHLIDVENLIGSARPSLRDVIACRKRYEDRVPVGPNDLIVVACNHGAFGAAAFGWRHARVILRSGADGADRALLEVIRREQLDARFHHVVIASGDGLFATAVARLATLGLEVTVVSNARALSRRLRFAAKRVVLFDAKPEPAEPAAALKEAA